MAIQTTAPETSKADIRVLAKADFKKKMLRGASHGGETSINKNSKHRYSLWPTIRDRQEASVAARQGFHAAVLCSVATALIAVLGGLGFKVMGFDLWCLIDAGLMGLLALGIHRMSRTAAAIALLYYVAGRIDLWSQYGFQDPILVAIFGLMFLSSVRGTFAYHRFNARKRLDALNPQPASNLDEALSIGRLA